ncbi:DUF1564 family protein [Leptospira sarikeiensis]|uniref:DUF1564 family protein n=1 Tax=Leptospira sarikeiensis TaxID=2484943 RepID=A0A4R9KBX2_9LEPT|nr:DUF1564 family protein [Leptospira sarikeiensis]TGL63289.1 DUF1564 family protein [Leptospira sarikeiensis]
MKLKLIFNPKPLKSKSFKARSSSRDSMPVCTLILPKSLFKDYLRTWNGTRSGARCLKDLLEIYGPDLQFHGKLNPDSILMMYQKKEIGKNKDWNRLNFRPDLADWNRLGAYARKHGVSKCYLFTFLLEKYFSDKPNPGLLKKKKVA